MTDAAVLPCVKKVTRDAFRIICSAEPTRQSVSTMWNGQEIESHAVKPTAI